MVRRGKLAIQIAVFTVGWLVYGSATASTFVGEIPVGYSDNLFQIGAGHFVVADRYQCIWHPRSGHMRLLQQHPY